MLGGTQIKQAMVILNRTEQAVGIELRIVFLELFPVFAGVAAPGQGFVIHLHVESIAEKAFVVQADFTISVKIGGQTHCFIRAVRRRKQNPGV